MKPSRLAARLEEFREWLALGHCKIKDRAGRLVSLELNRLQDRVLATMQRQANAGRPVRIVILKARKGGSSTLIQALQYFLTKTTPHWFSETVAHTGVSTKEIFTITKRIRRNDPDRPPKERPPSTRTLEFKDIDSVFVTETGGGHYVGSGSTINALHLSELAKWKGAPGVIEDQLASLRNAVPDHPDTLIVIESTANRADTSGQFERIWREAVGGLNGYAPVFSAWYDEETYYVKPGKDNRVGDLSEYETELRASAKLTDGQVLWLRKKTAELGEMLRKQEFPSTPEEAFQVATGKIFPMLRREKHDRQIEDLTGWELYRGVDWGGAHPFVCAWVAHKPGVPGFSIDGHACPNTWKQFAEWKRDVQGRPHALGDDAVDAVRYVVMEWLLTGWVHVYRELFIRDTAMRGLSLLNIGETIKQMSLAEQYIGTVCDRSQPNNVNLFNQRGIPAMSHRKPSTVRLSELEDGIAYLHTLLVADVPLIDPDPPPLLVEQIIADRERNGGHYGLDLETRFEILRHKRRKSRESGRVPREAVHPQLGEMY